VLSGESVIYYLCVPRRCVILYTYRHRENEVADSTKPRLAEILARQARLYGQVDNATYLARLAPADPANSASNHGECDFRFSLPDTTPADALAVSEGTLFRRQA
jgi:hypothetical protein